MTRDLELIDIKKTAKLTGYSEPSIRWKVARARKGLCDFVLPLDRKRGEKLQFLRAAVEDWILQRHEKSNPHKGSACAERVSSETQDRLARHGLATK